MAAEPSHSKRIPLSFGLPLVCVGTFIVAKLGLLEASAYYTQSFPIAKDFLLSPWITVANSLAASWAIWVALTSGGKNPELALGLKILVAVDLLLYGVLSFVRV